MKTSELTGAALDWAVAKCEGELEVVQYSSVASSKHYFAPSRKWAQGGPIIEREKIATDWDHDCWNASTDRHPAYYSGPTPLIAAMRCYVASKIGDDIEIPEELL